MALHSWVLTSWPVEFLRGFICETQGKTQFVCSQKGGRRWNNSDDECKYTRRRLQSQTTTVMPRRRTRMEAARYHDDDSARQGRVNTGWSESTPRTACSYSRSTSGFLHTRGMSKPWPCLFSAQPAMFPATVLLKTLLLEDHLRSCLLCETK